jgi:DNA modification methylase
MTSIRACDVVNRIHLGRAEEVLRGFPQVVHLTVTSPPYWDLKSYEGTEIGSLEEFMQEQRSVFELVFAATLPGGFLACNIGTRVSMNDHSHLPFMFFSMLMECGFSYRREHIWVRPKGSHGVWQRGTTAFMRHYPHPKLVMTNIQHEYIFIMQKPGDPEVDRSLCLNDDYIKDTCWSVWPISPAYTPGNEHPAPFPEELVDRLVVLYSNPGDVVLDPFVGSGTTTAVAKGRGRRWVGVECEPRYVSFANDRMLAYDGDGMINPYATNRAEQSEFAMG